jgi:coproporphyrinogen III oxidase-like Fe-S oxidoreductase
MLSLVTVPLPPAARVSEPEDDRAYLRQRMRGPQRHRLLHGYPLAAALPRGEAAHPADDVRPDRAAGRGLLVGVLPHPFCNPAVTGCGFCTFPHQAYHSDRAAAVVEHVAREVEERLARQPDLHRRRVAGLYFGGGTANLSPAGPFRRLCRRLAEAFDLSGAEVTLEGVPAYFVRRRPLLVDILREELPARHFRLSMGVQTFDEDRLRQMGRLAFGTEPTFREVVGLAHRLGFTASADLLFNLPGQTRAEMRSDVLRAVDLGLDHLGLYHLVLFRGLGTAWARDPEMLAALPPNEEAADNWLDLRALLLERGFYQATLTNFERAGFRGDGRRFVYEEHSFRADRHDMLGFGPSAISFAADRDFGGGLKVVNPDDADDYVRAVAAGRPAWDRSFAYGPRDLRVFYLTRRLAALAIERPRYRRLFGADPLEDFPSEFGAAAAEGLVEVSDALVRPTPRGAFYADSVAALLARRRVRGWRRSPGRGNDNGAGHM